MEFYILSNKAMGLYSSCDWPEVFSRLDGSRKGDGFVLTCSYTKDEILTITTVYDVRRVGDKVEFSDIEVREIDPRNTGIVEGKRH